MRKLALFSLAAFSTSAFAQFSAPKELADLKWMLGTWESDFTMEMQGQKAPGKGVMEITDEGMFIKLKATFDFGVFTMKEDMYLGWDAAKKRYFMHAFTNVGADPRIEYGTLKDGKLTMTTEPWGPGKDVGKSGLWAEGKEKVIFKLDMKSGDKWVPSMDSVWTPVKTG